MTYATFSLKGLWHEHTATLTQLYLSEVTVIQSALTNRNVWNVPNKFYACAPSKNNQQGINQTESFGLKLLERFAPM